MKKHSKPSPQPKHCEGNLTRPGTASQLHGAYEFQAITPNHKDGRTAPDGSIPLDQVIEAKDFAFVLDCAMAVNGIIKRRASAHRFIWSFMFVDKGVHVLK